MQSLRVIPTNSRGSFGHDDDLPRPLRWIDQFRFWKTESSASAWSCRTNPGKTERVEQWLQFLNSNMPAVLETLEGERMYVETIFSETLDGAEYLYWYSIQGRGGTEVRDSVHWIDAKHLEYWDECIDPEFTPQTLATRVSMIPQRILEQMQ
ncbi:DUF6176 family protein [Glutamicibacter protophormiae]|uniref:DUF6176 family protein n=1 Tax=Glutamicibacter protophormiae TaxID=37930 RepID=UPI002A8312E6|nr:DUF6176 family protein [Glutamicibacter protophormiae]WPR65369.1 DUF6176 family protein [Glutamicibacter protophormiae]WPR68867.1 DUF6176 family protein [Glutamicibacter protophormiae]